MLRRKLLTRIGLLVACFVAGAVVAISLLQEAISEVDRINQDAIVLVDGVQTANECVAAIEDSRDGIAVIHTQLNSLPETQLTQTLASIGLHPAVKIAGSPQAEAFAKVQTLLPEFLGTSQSSPRESQQVRAAMRTSLHDLTHHVRLFVAAEQTRFGSYFRGLVLALTLSALVMANVAVFVLLRTAQVVLKPVGELVAGSRELAAEHFDHRVNVNQQDEFGELAAAYNLLAEQLQANEERKAEALRQLAVTLNHDLNNAMATIEMQLSLLDRKSGSDSKLAQYFRDIHSTLSRMGSTIASLKHIRRVVLMEYVDGQKMVDLERSVALPGQPADAVTRKVEIRSDSASSIRTSHGSVT